VKSSDFSRFALSTCVAAAMLAGCSRGSQPPIGAGAMPQSAAIATHAAPGKSWMLSEAKSETLVYAAGGCGGTCVLSYTQGNVVGALGTTGVATCADSRGDVFMTNNSVVVEYSHGASKTSATLNLPGDDAAGCSVDSKTGNLAVVFVGQNNDIAVFPGAQGSPTLYTSGLESLYCGYDNAGNLFVSGYKSGQPGFSELVSGGSMFTTLSISSSVGTPGQVQWDGKYITYEGRDKGHVKFSRLQISGSTANVVDAVTIRGIKGSAYQSWIYGGTILIPYSNHRTITRNVSLWKYPKGGKIVRKLNFGTYKQGLHLQGITVSV
jgi:hypothetical protein